MELRGKRRNIIIWNTRLDREHHIDPMGIEEDNIIPQVWASAAARTDLSCR